MGYRGPEPAPLRRRATRNPLTPKQQQWHQRETLARREDDPPFYRLPWWLIAFAITCYYILGALSATQ
jgi:hypothetical protein